MRISDWSSDVCSSDLRTAAGNRNLRHKAIVSDVGLDFPLIVRWGREVAFRVIRGSIEGEMLHRPGYRNIEDALLFFVILGRVRSEEHTSELNPLMRSSYAVFCLKQKN